MIERVQDGHGGSRLHDADTDKTPWRRSNNSSKALLAPSAQLPAHLDITLADGVYVERLSLPQPLVYAIARFAAFPNPHWHELERVHRSTWNIARYVDKSQLLPRYVKVPRGCADAVFELLGRAIAVRSNPAGEERSRLNSSVFPSASISRFLMFITLKYAMKKWFVQPLLS